MSFEASSCAAFVALLSLLQCLPAEGIVTPEILSLHPAFLDPLGGTRLTITGRNLVAGGVNSTASATTSTGSTGATASGAAAAAGTADTAASAGASTSGSIACKCLEAESVKQQLVAAGYANVNGNLADERGNSYLITYGVSCRKHDEFQAPTCADASGQRLAGAPDWCYDQWCYVSGSSCTYADKTTSAVGYFPDAPELFFSYQTCGSGSSFTSVPGAMAIQIGGARCTSPRIMDRGGNTVSCTAPAGIDANLPVVIEVGGDGGGGTISSVVTRDSPRVSYLPPTILGTNLTWGVEGAMVAIDGTDLNPAEPVFCRTGADSTVTILGEFRSSTRVVCALGAAKGYPGDRLDLFISQDKFRWINSVQSAEDAITWYDGTALVPRKPRNAPAEVKVGAVFNALGNDCNRAVRTVVGELNADPVFLRYTKLVVVETETAGNATRAGEDMRRLALSEGLVGYLGAEWSSTSVVLNEVATELALPLVSFSSSVDELGSTANYPFFVRNYYTGAFRYRIVDAMVRALGWRRLVLMFSDRRWAEEGANIIEQSFQASSRDGYRIMQRDRVTENATDVDGRTTQEYFASRITTALTRRPQPRIFVVELYHVHSILAFLRALAVKVRSESTTAEGLAGPDPMQGFAVVLPMYSYGLLEGMVPPAAQEGMPDLVPVPAGWKVPGHGVLGFGDGSIGSSTLLDPATVEEYWWPYCVDSVYVMAAALDSVIVGDEFPVVPASSPNRAAREHLLKHLRQVRVAGRISGTGTVAFEGGSNNRDSSTLQLKVVNLRQPQQTGSPYESVELGQVSGTGQFLPKPGTAVVWPGDLQPGPPRDVSTPWLFKRVFLISADSRPDAQEWAAMAVHEIQSRPGFLKAVYGVDFEVVTFPTNTTMASYADTVGEFINAQEFASVTTAVIGMMPRDDTACAFFNGRKLGRRGQEMLIATPHCRDTALASPLSYPSTIRMMASNGQMAIALVNFLQHYRFSAVTIVRMPSVHTTNSTTTSGNSSGSSSSSSGGSGTSKDPQRTSQLADAIQAQASALNIETLTIECSADTAGAVDWSRAASFSNILVIALDASSFGACVSSAQLQVSSADEGTSSHHDPRFQLVLPFAQSILEETGVATNASLAALLRGSIGIGQPVKIKRTSARLTRFTDFWGGASKTPTTEAVAFWTSRGLPVPDAGSLPGDVLVDEVAATASAQASGVGPKTYETIMAVAQGVMSCLGAEKWAYEEEISADAVNLTQPRGPGSVGECDCLSQEEVIARLAAGGYYNAEQRRFVPASNAAENVFNSFNSFPETHGVGCYPHDFMFPPYCRNEDLSLKKDAPTWCFMSWCWVDQASCKLPGSSASSSFTNANLAWNYETCGVNGFSLVPPELRKCIHDLASESTDDGLFGPVTFKAGSNDRDLSLRVLNLPANNILADKGSVSVSEGAVRVCSGESLSGAAGRVGSSCEEEIAVPSIRGLSPACSDSTGKLDTISTWGCANRTVGAVVRWQHAAPSDPALLSGYRVYLREKGGGGGQPPTTVTLSVPRGQDVLFLPSQEDDTTTSKAALGKEGKDSLSSGNTHLTEGTVYNLRIAAEYAQGVVSSRSHSTRQDVCLAAHGVPNTCRAQDDQFNPRGQPHVPVSEWYPPQQCPRGALCEGRLWQDIQSTPGYFLMLPDCVNETSSSVISSLPCKTVPGLKPCSAVNLMPRGRPALNYSDPLVTGAERHACPGNASIVVAGDSWSVTAQCAPGHVGVLCGACDDDWFMDEGRKCVKCAFSKVDARLIVTGIVLGLLVVGIAAFVLAQRLCQLPRIEHGMMKSVSKVSARSSMKDMFHDMAGSDLELSFDEFKEYLRKQGISRGDGGKKEAKEIQDLFDHLDWEDHNMNVSWSEFQRFVLGITQGKTSSSRCRRFGLAIYKWGAGLRVKTLLTILVSYLQIYWSIDANFPALNRPVYTRPCEAPTGEDKSDSSSSSSLAGVFELVTNVNLSVLALFRCANGERWSSMLFAVVFVPFGLIAFLWVSRIVLDAIRKRRGKGQQLSFLRDQCITGIATTLFLCYPSMCRNLLATEICVYIPTNTPSNTTNYFPYRRNETWLRIDGTVQCKTDDPTYQWLRPLSMALFFAVAFGLPLLVPILLYPFRWPVDRLYTFSDHGMPEASRVGVDSISFIYEKYNPGWWYFESIEMIRKLLLSAAIGGVYLGEDLGDDTGRLLLGAFFSVLFASAFLVSRPYVFNAGNRIQALSHLALAYLYVDGAIVLQSEEPKGQYFCGLRQFRGAVALLPVVYALFESLPIKPAKMFRLLLGAIKRRVKMRFEKSELLSTYPAWPSSEMGEQISEDLATRASQGRRAVVICGIARKFRRALWHRAHECAVKFARNNWNAEPLGRKAQHIVDEIGLLELEYTSTFVTTWDRLVHLEQHVNMLLLMYEDGPQLADVSDHGKHGTIQLTNHFHHEGKGATTAEDDLSTVAVNGDTAKQDGQSLHPAEVVGGNGIELTTIITFEKEEETEIDTSVVDFDDHAEAMDDGGGETKQLARDEKTPDSVQRLLAPSFEEAADGMEEHGGAQPSPAKGAESEDANTYAASAAANANAVGDDRDNDHAAFARDLVLAAVRKSGKALAFASPRLKHDRAVVAAAVEQDGLALQYAAPKLRSRPSLVATAVEQNAIAKCFELTKAGSMTIGARRASGMRFSNLAHHLATDFHREGDHGSIHPPFGMTQMVLQQLMLVMWKGRAGVLLAKEELEFANKESAYYLTQKEI